MAQSTQPSEQELSDQIRALETQVRQLQTTQQNLDSAAVDDTVERVLHDADRRSKLMAVNGAGINWSNGKLTIQSDTGDFLLHPWMQFQFRLAVNALDTSDDYSVENGFEVRRLKFGVDGNAFSPKLTYAFIWATSRNGGGVSLEEAWARYAITKEWSVLGGQFKGPFAHESIVSSKRLLAADRTIGDDYFTGGDDFVQGVAAIYSVDQWRALGSLHDGARNNFNQDFQDFPTNNATWGAAGRVEYKFMGDWKNYDDFTALSTKNDLLVVGAAADYTEAGDTTFLLHTIDAQYENGQGLGIYGAFIGRYTKNGPVSPTTPTGAVNDLYDFSFVAQCAYLFENNWEPFVRYDLLNLDQDGLAAGSENIVHTFTAGVNYYMQGHDSKFTLDFMYLPNGTPVSDEGADILTNNGNTEFVFRAQYQLLL
ncbi:MAG: hypothetical protein H7Z14_19255 [Anaerolineae bacterium]|nr:hypothetical protein [Phycisphaerae bacterium]